MTRLTIHFDKKKIDSRNIDKLKDTLQKSYNDFACKCRGDNEYFHEFTVKEIDNYVILHTEH